MARNLRAKLQEKKQAFAPVERERKGKEDLFKELEQKYNNSPFFNAIYVSFCAALIFWSIVLPFVNRELAIDVFFAMFLLLIGSIWWVNTWMEKHSQYRNLKKQLKDSRQSYDELRGEIEELKSQIEADEINIESRLEKALKEYLDRFTPPSEPKFDDLHNKQWRFDKVDFNCEFAVKTPYFSPSVPYLSDLDTFKHKYDQFNLSFSDYIYAANPPKKQEITYSKQFLEPPVKPDVRDSDFRHRAGGEADIRDLPKWLTESVSREILIDLIARAGDRKNLQKRLNKIFHQTVTQRTEFSMKFSELRKKFDLHEAKEIRDYERRWREGNKLWSDKMSGLDIPESLYNAVNYLFLCPLWVSKKVEFNFDRDNSILIAELRLPNLDTEIRKRVDGKDKKATISETTQFRDDFSYIYILSFLKFLSEILRDQAELIVINGYREYIDPATGKDATNYTLSISCAPGRMDDIDLTRVVPKTCFKSLRGIVGGPPSEIIPIQPILQFDKSKNKFVDGKDVIEDYEGMNLAAMDWQDFEQLVREIFSKEYSSEGEEVKITQSSRDQGIDAVIFDPDPIRGGKVIVQAKRYTNTVDVSYVRDLYGTLVNEGAMKGILITTSSFGRDSVEFAKDKPITLINGSQLLFLLEKHGYQAKIDLKEAKKILSEQKI